LLGGCGFFVSDVISEGLLGHLGPLCLALFSLITGLKWQKYLFPAFFK